jgi:hypothetical protein
MSWQFTLLSQFYDRFSYDVPVEGVKIRTIGFPSQGELYRSHRRSLFKAAVLRCKGSLDCKNVVIGFAEGTGFSSPRTLYRARLSDIYATGLIADGVPHIVKWDDSDKDYVFKWTPGEPLPFRYLFIYYIAPPKLLDTVDEAVLQYTYLVINVD